MNLFLGCYVPSDSWERLWELESDYHLHNKSDSTKLLCNINWWSVSENDYKTRIPVLLPENSMDKLLLFKLFQDHYQAHKLTSFDKILVIGGTTVPLHPYYEIEGNVKAPTDNFGRYLPGVKKWFSKGGNVVKPDKLQKSITHRPHSSSLTKKKTAISYDELAYYSYKVYGIKLNTSMQDVTLYSKYKLLQNVPAGVSRKHQIEKPHEKYYNDHSVLKLLAVSKEKPCFNSNDIKINPESLKFNTNYAHNWAAQQLNLQPPKLTVTDGNARMYNQLYQFCNQPLKLGNYEIAFNEKIKD